jgi:hypothetical protein
VVVPKTLPEDFKSETDTSSAHHDGMWESGGIKVSWSGGQLHAPATLAPANKLTVFIGYDV